MDYDLLLVAGGCCRLLLDPELHTCMAKDHEGVVQTHHRLVAFWLLFLFVLLLALAPPAHQLRTPTQSPPAKKLPSTASSTSSSPAPVSSQSMKLHRRGAPTSKAAGFKAKAAGFRANAHEVPSGPNPISNR